MHLENRGRELGLLSGTTDYCRFVIVCSIRTGSTMLCSLLNSHPSVLTYFELFHRHLASVPFGLPGYKWLSNDKRVVELHNEDPVEFLNRYIYSRKRLGVRAVGFKLLYTQARVKDPWWNGPEFDRWWRVVGRAPLLTNAKSDLWQYLADDKTLRIIHLKRRNYLKRIVSGQTAIATGHWGIGATGGIGEKRSISIELDGNDLLQDFEAFRRMEEETDELFANHKKIEVYYEDLIGDQQATCKQIQEFLGLNPVTLYAKTEKQSTEPVSETISNFQELKARFKDTPWAPFFDDNFA